MKKVLLLLAMVFGLCSIATATQYDTGSLANQKPWSSSGSSATLNQVAWTISFDKGAVDKDANGFKIGSNKTYPQSVTLKTSGITGTINKISVTTSCGASWVGNVSATVNGVEYTTADSNTTVSRYGSTFEFTGSAEGEIVLTWKLSSGNGAIYIKQILVDYTDGGSSGGDDTVVPELPVVTFLGTTAVNGESYEVIAGTRVSVSSKNATTVYVNGTAMDSFVVNEAGSYTIYGENANGKSDEFTVSFTIKEAPKPGEDVTATIVMKNQSDLKYAKNKTINWVSEDEAYTFSTIATITGSTYPTSNNGNLRIYNSNGNTITVNAPEGYELVSASYVLGTAANHISINDTDYASSNNTCTFSDGTTSFTLKSVKSASNNNSDIVSMTFVLKAIKQTPAEPETYDPVFEPISIYPEETTQINLPGEKHPIVSYKSNDEAIATVSETGIVTGVTTGNTTITVSWTGDEEWNAGSKDIIVEVKKALADPELWFRHAEIHGKINVGVAAQAVHHKSPGKITYSSSDESVVTVSATTGMITPSDVHSVGTAVITATIEATEEYKDGSVSYIVVIEAPEYGATVPEGRKMYDFRTTNAYGMYEFDDSNSKVGDAQIYESNRDKKDGNTPVTEITSVEPITLSFEYNDKDMTTYRLWKASKGSHLRHYDGSMVFTVPTGYSIEKILFNGEKFYNGSCTYNSTIGSFVVGAPEGEEDVTAYWIDTNNLNPTTVKLTREGGSYIIIKTCTVVLKKAESDRTIADLKFEQRIYNTYVDEDTEINAVSSPNLANIPSKNIKYSIDNLTGNDYFIGRESESDGKLLVNVKTPGVYTLRVVSDATETLLPGVAILRLNVFPKVELEHNAEEVADELMIVPAEGGTLKFGELPSTLTLMVKRGGEADFKAHDGSELTFAEDDNLEYYMEYAETYRHGESKLEVVVRPTVPTHDEASGTHTFAPSKGAMLYHTTPTVETPAKQMAPAANGDEWTKLAKDDVLSINPADYINLNAGQRLVFTAKSVKVASNGTEVEGPAKRFAILSNGQLSGVEDVEIEAEGAVRFYNLNGVEVDAANMAPGMYIRRSGSKAEKVVVK